MAKEIPDHRSVTFEYKELFSDDNAKKIAETFDINPYKLKDKLNNATYWYQVLDANSTPSIPEQREILEKINKHAAALDALFGKCGNEEIKRIVTSRPDIENSTLSEFSFFQTEINIKKLNHLSKAAIDQLLKKRSGKDKSLPSLIFHLLELYRLKTKDKRTVTYNDYKNQNTGPTIEFITMCLELLNIHKSNSHIAGLIKDASKDLPNDSLKNI